MIAAVAALLLTGEPIDLQLRLAIGDRLIQHGALSFRDDEEDLTLTYTIRRETSVRQAGTQFLLEFADTVTASTMDGASLQSGPDPVPTRFSLELGERGDIVTLKPHAIDPGLQWRIARLTTVGLPPNRIVVGDEWRVERPRSAEGAPPFAATYRLTALRTVQERRLAEFSFEYRETAGGKPLRATGAGSLDLATGWPWRLEMQVQNLPAPGGDDTPMDASIAWKVVDFVKGR
jgi:hypothetical protein